MQIFSKKNHQSELFEALFNNTNDKVVILDADLKILNANVAFSLEMYLSEQALIGKNFSDFVIKEDLQKLTKAISSQTGSGQAVIYTQFKHGYLHQLTWSITKIRQNKQTCFLLVSKNPTYSDLVDKLITLETMIDNMPCNVYWMNKDLIHMGCNNNVLNMLEISREKYIGSTYEDLSEWANWPEGLAESFKRDDIEILKSGKPKFGVEEPSFIDKKGRKLCYFTSRVPLRNAKGEIIGVAGISTDITEIKDVQEELKETVKKLDQANKAKSDFIANMSHDIRTPIAGMLGLIELLRVNSESEENKKNATVLASVTKELLAFYNEILDLASIESGGYYPQNQPFNLFEILEHNFNMLEASARYKKIGFNLKVYKNVPLNLIGDHHLIKRILLNLLNNAIKFTTSGSVNLVVRVKKNKDPKKVTLKIIVRDTGVGIPKDKFDIIFDNFSRLTPAYEGRYKGSGLGLYTVKNYVNCLEGEIKVESEINVGTTFTVELPVILNRKAKRSKNERRSMSLSDKNVSDVTSPSVRKKKRGGNNKILLVEDSGLAAIAAKNLLKELGYEVDVAPDGREALSQLQANNYKFMMLDIGLPDISGLAVSKQVRSSSKPSLRKMPIIALTGHVSPDEKGNCLAYGVNEVLSKPLSKEAAEKAIDQYVNNL